VDILGNKKYVENALISSIDVSRERLEILQQPELERELWKKRANKI